ncbi:M61 family metallopeptidase [Moraxella boevrei]|uniref:M61 family metallopeptidase n=1 Tax=Faucicola boevrei TaxID=346665 RepID=UPI003735E91F
MSKLHYTLDFQRFREHLADVSLTFTAHTDNPTVWLPTWIAGSYLIREFAKNITALTAKIGDKTQRCKKIHKNAWQILAKQGDIITVNYEVYAYDLSVRTAYFDQTRLYGNFSALAVAILGQENAPILVELICPNAFLQSPYHDGFEPTLATALPDKMHQQRTQTIYQLTANNYEELTDSPFEIAVQDGFEFEVFNQYKQPILHRFLLSGKHSADLERLHDDIAKICQFYVDWLGDTPFDDYTFMTLATGNDYGGLEHLSSTSLVTPRDDLPSYQEKAEPSDNYQTFLGLCSHEYFHAWWVKTVCPSAMENPDLNQLFSRETNTNLLWVFEGFTSYFDDFVLQASGVISQDSYLNLLAKQINRYFQTQGRELQTLAESGYDAWLKLYRPDENSANAGVSYYNKGALVALCLDLTLKQHGKRLLNVVKHFYQLAKQNPSAKFGMTYENLNSVMYEFLPKQVWDNFRENYIDGLTELPLYELLSENGVIIKQRFENLAFGIKAIDEPYGLKIQRVLRNSQASQAGLSANDVLLAFDNIKASEKMLKQLALNQGEDDEILCHFFRRDELMQTCIQGGGSPRFEIWQLTATEKLEFLAKCV